MNLYNIYSAKGLENMSVIIDTNRSMIKGFMVESYLVDGNQKVGEGFYGKSITDPCLGWEKTEKLIYSIADQL